MVDNTINLLVTMDRVETTVAKMAEEVGERCLPITIRESWATSAHSVISHQEWVEICTHCLHNYQTGQMIMVLKFEVKEDLVDSQQRIKEKPKC